MKLTKLKGRLHKFFVNDRYKDSEVFKESIKKKYMDHAGNICPYCGSRDISISGVFDADGLHGWQDAVCGNCEKKWTDMYTLVDIEKV